MKKRICNVVLAVIAAIAILASCQDPSGSGGSNGGGTGIAAPAVENEDFTTASIPGESAELLLTGDLSVTMIYAKDDAAISFPDDYDNTWTTLDTPFFMGETEFTNGMAARVLQWAMDEGTLSADLSNHNGVSEETVKYGGQELVSLDDGTSHLTYSSAGGFASQSGYQNHPLVHVSWYGAVMICNWLSEMRDGNTDQVVYTGIDDTLDYSEISCDESKTGYRLPVHGEWQYAARYLGTEEPSTGDIATERKYGNDNSNWTDGYYWLPYTYASGANADYNNVAACRSVAVYSGQDPVPTEALMVGSCNASALGLYDMSGNVWEYEFTAHSANPASRLVDGGGWKLNAQYLRVGVVETVSAHAPFDNVGFRIYRTVETP